MTKMTKNNNNIKKIKGEVRLISLTDLTDFESRFSNNGGKYSFTTRFEREDETSPWQVSYGTSSDFPYCQYCGSFGDCFVPDEDEPDGGYYQCGGPKFISGEEVVDRLNQMIDKLSEPESTYYITAQSFGVTDYDSDIDMDADEAFECEENFVMQKDRDTFIIAGPYEQDDNFYTVYFNNTIYTIARSTDDWGSRKVGDGLSQKTYEEGKARCTKEGTFELSY